MTPPPFHAAMRPDPPSLLALGAGAALLLAALPTREPDLQPPPSRAAAATCDTAAAPPRTGPCLAVAEPGPCEPRAGAGAAQGPVPVPVEPMSASPLHEPRWYTFDIPFLPEGSGWVVCHERQVEGRIERCVTDPLTPTTLYHTFGAWIGPAGNWWGLVSDDCRVEDRRRVHVRLDPDEHDVLAGKMAAARWTVVDLGAYLAARELVAMLEAPDAREQAFAQQALRAAGREIDDARVLLQQHEAWGGRSAPVPRATDAVAQADAPQPGLVLVVRAFFAPPNFMRDVGVHWGSKGGTDPWALPTTPATRSWMSFLDDTEVSILVRASEKSPTLRNVVVREQSLPAGEPGVVDLGPCGCLTVEASLSQNRKFVDARVSVRRLLAEGLRFHPHRRIVLPVGGTVLLCAYDDHGPAIDETDPICFVLTLDSAAAGAQVAAAGDSGEHGS